MRVRLASFGFLTLALLRPSLASADMRQLSLEERIVLQEAIERIYYGHQVGATKPFEEAVPREVLERKVRTYLKQSEALEKYWSTAVTAEMLRKEVERMTSETKMPGRLRELFAALKDDPFLVQECLARPALVDRLARNFFADDSSIHSAERAEAEKLRKQLVRGDIDPMHEYSNRFVLNLTRAHQGKGGPTRAGSRDRLSLRARSQQREELEPEQFDGWRARLGGPVGEIGPLVDEREAFVIRVPLVNETERLRVATYVVQKTTWDEWWERVKDGLGDRSVRPAASGQYPLPRLDPLQRGGWSPRGCAQSLAQAGPVPESLPCTDDSWDNGPLDDPLDPRQGHTAVWTGSHMVIWGGLIGYGTDTGGRYDPALDTWTATSRVNAPAARLYHTAVWTGNLMVVWGGDYYDSNNTQALLDTGGRYDPATDTWTATSTTGAPSARYYHTTIWTGATMIVWGGFDDVNPLGDGGRYDPATDTWESISTVDAPAGRYYHTAVWTGTRMVIWGGLDNISELESGGRYDPSNDVWMPVSILGAPEGRYLHTATWTANLMLVWGGNNTGGAWFNTGGRYNPVTDTWTSISTTGAPSARSSHTAVWTGNRMVLWGGTSSGSTYTNSGGRYDPTTDTWSATSITNAPMSRVGHSAVWTGSQMVVWGGFSSLNDNGFNVNTGGRYDPVSDSWTPTSTTNAPVGRTDHTAVWTGNVMIVWGGDSLDEDLTNSGGRYDPAIDTWTPTSRLNAPTRRMAPGVWTGDVMVIWGGVVFDEPNSKSGGRYNPVTDTWAPTSKTNAPSGREFHTLVWSGTQMIVWGGWDGVSETASGGLYDPTADTWRSTSTANAPTGRTDHTAIWAGGVMMVWGGQGSGSFLDTGGLYDPGTDTWALVSTTKAPSARLYHTAVWTGSEVVVWGGFDGNRSVDTGGRYDPVTDHWVSMSRTSAPSARASLSAVWTGSRMIVWGGYDDLMDVDTGGTYDPATDSWMPTPTANVPLPRELHTAVWTGEFMIVWGGRANGNPTGTGGRYCACEAYYRDSDGDGHGDPGIFVQSCGRPVGYVSNADDCDDSDPSVWGTPTEARQLRLPDRVMLVWVAPSDPGASAYLYDLLRSDNADDFMTATTCVASDIGATSAVDTADPIAGGVFYYLVRAQNSSPCGTGSLGTDSNGVPRTGRACP